MLAFTQTWEESISKWMTFSRFLFNWKAWTPECSFQSRFIWCAIFMTGLINCSCIIVKKHTSLLLCGHCGCRSPVTTPLPWETRVSQTIAKPLMCLSVMFEEDVFARELLDDQLLVFLSDPDIFAHAYRQVRKQMDLRLLPSLILVHCSPHLENGAVTVSSQDHVCQTKPIC